MGPDTAAAVAGPEAVTREQKRRVFLGLWAALLGGYWLWLQWPSIALLPGDEPLYILDAQRLLAGGKLYRDIFLAHPPARVWQSALVLATGAPAGWAKFWSPLATLATAWLLSTLALRHSRLATAVWGMSVFLSAGVVLTYGGLFVGVEQVMFLATVATGLALAQRWLLAGLVLGFATQWALHVGILVLPLLFWARRAGALKRFAQGLALGLVPLVLELLWYGQPMVEQVFGYHLRKVTEMGEQKVPDRIWPFIRWNFAMMALAAIGVWRGGEPMRRMGLSGFAALAMLLLWPRLQPYYFLLPIPWLALAAGHAFEGKPLSMGYFHWPLLVLFLLGTGLRAEARQRHDANVVIQKEMTVFSAQVASLAQGHPLWGDGALVPLLALKTGLPVALGDTDLNSQRFLSGVTKPAAHLDLVLQQKPLVVLVPRHGIDLVPEIHDRLLRDCDVVGEFNAQTANFSGLLLRPR